MTKRGADAAGKSRTSPQERIVPNSARHTCEAAPQFRTDHISISSASQALFLPSTNQLISLLPKTVSWAPLSKKVTGLDAAAAGLAELAKRRRAL